MKLLKGRFDNEHKDAKQLALNNIEEDISEAK
jgi:hypothetical protein